MEPRSVAWVVAHDAVDLRGWAEPLRRLGFELRACTPGQSSELKADLRVLPADLGTDARQLRIEYVIDPTPTLILAATARQELDALEFMRESDDIARIDDAPELLARRLQRLAGRARSAGRLNELERFDPLTGLLKRDRFEELLVQRTEALPVGEATALLLLDLDHFKNVNDRHGQAAGDQVLREAAWLLRIDASPEDCIARVGGDEFAVLLTRYDRQTALHDAQRILQRLSGHAFRPGGPGSAEPATVTASAGLTFLQPHARASDILSQADIATYQAKGNGRMNLVVYENLRESAAAQDRDVYLQHFENVTRVVTERVTNLITQMGRRLVETARREANQDALTQLHNRRYFDARVARELDLARKHGRALALALIDIDHFRQVNGTYGWPTGDEVLRRFAATASHSIRLVDWLARYGGEEFCLVMPDTGLDDAVQVAERIRGNVEAATVESVDHRPLQVSVSIGVARFTPDLAGPLELVQKASDALLEAKQAGRNRVVARP